MDNITNLKKVANFEIPHDSFENIPNDYFRIKLIQIKKNNHHL